MQVLLDDERYARLERRAAETSQSIGALVRDAIDVAYPERAMSREQAFAVLRDAPRLDHGDAERVERELLARHEPE